MISLRTLRLTAAAGILLSVAHVVAGPPDVPATPAPISPWEFRLEPYLWASGIDGSVGVLFQQVPVELGFRNIAQHLKMSYAGQFEIRYNRWGLLTDIFYADIGGYIPVRDPRIHQFAYDTKMVIFQVVPNYRLWRSDKGFFDLLAGIRGWDMKARLTGFRDVGILVRDFRYFNRSDSKAWVDFIGGVRGQYFLYQGLFVAAYGDIGGGSSTLTWQVQGTMGYKFSKLISAELGWRLLSDNYQSGGFIYNVKQQGLFTGVSFTW